MLDLDKEHNFALARKIEPLDLRSLEWMGVIFKVGDVYQFTPPGEGRPQPRVPPTAPSTEPPPHTDQAGPSSYQAPPVWDSSYQNLQDSVEELGTQVARLDGRLAALQVFTRIQAENQAAFYSQIGFQLPHHPPS